MPVTTRCLGGILILLFCGCGSAIAPENSENSVQNASSANDASTANGNTVTVTVEPPSLTLAWDPSSGANGYKIYYGKASGNYTEAIDVKEAVAYTLIKLPPSGYYFAVTAYSSFGESAYSDELFAAVPE